MASLAAEMAGGETAAITAAGVAAISWRNSWP